MRHYVITYALIYLNLHYSEHLLYSEHPTEHCGHYAGKGSKERQNSSWGRRTAPVLGGILAQVLVLELQMVQWKELVGQVSSSRLAKPCRKSGGGGGAGGGDGL